MRERQVLVSGIQLGLRRLVGFVGVVSFKVRVIGVGDFSDDVLILRHVRQERASGWNYHRGNRTDPFSGRGHVHLVRLETYPRRTLGIGNNLHLDLTGE